MFAAGRIARAKNLHLVRRPIIPTPKAVDKQVFVSYHRQYAFFERIAGRPTPAAGVLGGRTSMSRKRTGLTIDWFGVELKQFLRHIGEQYIFARQMDSHS